MGKDVLRYWAHEACQPYAEASHTGAPPNMITSQRGLAAAEQTVETLWQVANFVSSWVDGLALCALLSHCRKVSEPPSHINTHTHTYTHAC